MNSPWSNVKLEGQMNSEFDEFAIHGKLMKRGFQWNQNQVIWNYNQNEEYYELICKIKLLSLIKLKLPPDNRSNLTTNPIAARMGIQFSSIEENLLGFFLADVQSSSGKFDEMKEKFAINPALTALQSSLNAGGITMN